MGGAIISELGGGIIPLQGGGIIPELGGGFLRNQHGRRVVEPGRLAADLGALLFGYYADDGKLIYAGRVAQGCP